MRFSSVSAISVIAGTALVLVATAAFGSAGDADEPEPRQIAGTPLAARFTEAFPVQIGDTRQSAEEKLRKAATRVDVRALPGEVILGATGTFKTPLGTVKGLSVRLLGNDAVTTIEFVVPMKKRHGCQPLMKKFRENLAGWRIGGVKKTQDGSSVEAEIPGDFQLTGECDEWMGAFIVRLRDAWTMLVTGKSTGMLREVRVWQLATVYLDDYVAASRAVGDVRPSNWGPVQRDIVAGLAHAARESDKLTPRGHDALTKFGDQLSSPEWFNAQMRLVAP